MIELPISRSGVGGFFSPGGSAAGFHQGGLGAAGVPA